MENKCNKTPNSGKNNTTNSKYMDHVYCHSNQTKSSYNINAVPGSGGGGGASASPNADVLALLKENKQLKSMLILHLDLIQEQSDQLMAKEKLLITRNEEIESLRTRNALLDNQVKELQKQLQQQIKRSGEVSTLPPPPLAKIQCKANPSLPVAALNSVPTNCAKVISTTGTSNIIGECNGKLISKIVLQRVNMSLGRGKHNQSPQSHTTDTENDEDAEDDGEDEDQDDDEEEDAEGVCDGEDACVEDEEAESQQDENLEQDEDEVEHIQAGEEEEVAHYQDSVDEKSNAHQDVIDELYDTGNTTEDSNEVLAVQSKRLRLRQAAKQSLTIPRGAKPSISPASTTTSDGQTAFKAVASSTSSSKNLSKQPLTPSRGKQMTIMRWHAPDYNTDESVSCDSTVENERRSALATSSSIKVSPYVAEKKRSHDNSSHISHHRQKVRRCTYISTPILYSTRDWEDEVFSCDYDYEFFKVESKLLQADNPKLEIPKWTEHELTPSYCIEGTEDLSDETFLKRHAKLEVDEKRRKKWDVQQIREQRRIERLKRRHCKDEIQPSHDTPSLQTFFPTTESLQSICFVQDLPVQAFGEMIPRLTSAVYTDANGEIRRNFQLPWLDKEQLKYLNENNKSPTVTTINSTEAAISASLQMQQQMLNSSFVFLKKRKRQQSSSYGNLHHIPRQRNPASKLPSINNPLNTITPSHTTASTQSFLNIVKSTVTSNTLTVSTPSTTYATSQGLVSDVNGLQI